jgi:hypothetical protein
MKGKLFEWRAAIAQRSLIPIRSPAPGPARQIFAPTASLLPILFSPSFITQLELGSYCRLKTLAVERFPRHVATQVLP